MESLICFRLVSDLMCEQKLPKYLQRIKTFYNPLDFEDSDSETEAVSEESTQSEIPEVMAATSAEVENLLKKYSSQKLKLHVLEPCTFGGTYR